MKYIVQCRRTIDNAPYYVGTTTGGVAKWSGNKDHAKRFDGKRDLLVEMTSGAFDGWWDGLCETWGAEIVEVDE